MGSPHRKTSTSHRFIVMLIMYSNGLEHRVAVILRVILV